MSTIDLTKAGTPDDEPERGKPPVGELQPLLPAWMRDRAQLLDTTRKATRRGAHRATWHLLRLPIYVVRLLLMSPRGLWRVVKVIYGILSDGQGHQLRVEAATGSDAATWLKLRQERNERIHRRMLVAATLGAPVGVFVLAALAPTWFAWLLGLVVFLWVFRQLGDLTGFGIALAAGGALVWFLPGLIPVLPLPSPGVLWMGVFLALLGLGWIGRPIGKSLVKPATVLAGNHGPLRAPFVMEALCSLGIAGLNEKTMDQIGLLFDVARVGPGYQVDLELPRGVAARSVMERRGKLSAALRRELGTVWPSVGKRHEGHLVLYVCDQPMTEAKQTPWALARDGAVDLFQPVPMFTDQRGGWVSVTFAYANMVVGAQPRMGKALALNTPVPTPSGWSTMGELRTGDEVFDEQGSSCRVAAAHPVQHDRRCYEVLFSDGSSVVADADHLWQVETRATRAGRCPEKVMTTSELIDHGVRTGSDSRANYSVRVAGPLALPDAELPVPPYTLGAWLGDGTSVTGVVTSPDPEVIAEIRDEGERVEMVASTAGFTAPGWRVFGLTARLRDDLSLLGEKHIPPAYLRASVQQRRALLAGLLDTDGWCEKWGTVRFAVTSPRLAKDTRRLIATLGYQSRLSCRPARLNGREVGTVWEIRFCPDQAVFRLPRKVERQAAAHNKASNQRRFIRDIRSVPSIPVRCITVDSPSSLYLVGDQCIPTHNTFLVRQALLVAGLDPRAQVYAIDGKGTGDLSPCSLFAHFYSVGEEPEEVKRVLTALRGLRHELRRRARVIRELSREECPDSKVTSVLASRRDLRLEPIVVGIDETQVYFEDQPKPIRDELVAIITDLVKRGPALGVIVILATQNVTATTIPTPISNNAVIRFCLKVFGHTAVDQVLGTGAYKAGLDAQMFDLDDKGIGYLRADGTVAQIVRTVFGLNAPAAEKIALRARSLRATAGRLTGAALGDVMEAEAEQVVLLDDCREVMDTGRAKRMHLGELVDKLALLRPGIYGHLDNDSLGSMLRQAGVTPGTVWSPIAKRDGWGVKRESLDVSTTEVIGLVRDDEQGDESA